MRQYPADARPDLKVFSFCPVYVAIFRRPRENYPGIYLDNDTRRVSQRPASIPAPACIQNWEVRPVYFLF